MFPGGAGRGLDALQLPLAEVYTTLVPNASAKKKSANFALASRFEGAIGLAPLSFHAWLGSRDATRNAKLGILPITLEPGNARLETRMVPRLRHGAEPEPIDATIKTLKATWPRLAAKCETGAATTESGFQESETGKVEPQTRAAKSESGLEKPQIQPERPLSDKLFSLFGGGDNPSLRRALYIRVQLTCQTFGKPAEMIVREVCEAARRARSPGNYFAFAIVRRLRENGFIQEV